MDFFPDLHLGMGDFELFLSSFIRGVICGGMLGYAGSKMIYWRAVDILTKQIEEERKEKMEEK